MKNKVSEEEVKSFWKNGGEIKLFRGKLRIKYDKKDNLFGIYGKRWYVDDIDKVWSAINTVLMFQTRDKISISIRKIDIGKFYSRYRYVLGLLVYNYRQNSVVVKSVYMINGKIEVYLDDFNKIQGNEKEFDNFIEEMELKTKNSLLNGKYSIGDILKHRGLKIYEASSDLEGAYARLSWGEERGEKYRVLKVPNNSKIIVKQKGYDLAGSVVFKCLVVQGTEIIQVFLLGKEYTGNWWLHSLPPSYWNRSISQCERWLLDLRKGDVVVSEA